MSVSAPASARCPFIGSMPRRLVKSLSLGSLFVSLPVVIILARVCLCRTSTLSFSVSLVAPHSHLAMFVLFCSFVRSEKKEKSKDKPKSDDKPKHEDFLNL